MAQMDQAADAVRHIGTNALPFLLRWLSDEPAPWRRKTRRALEKLPHPFDRLGRLTDARMGPKSDLRHRLAIYGFIVLGPDAAPAIPALNRLATITNSSVIILHYLALWHIQGDQLSLDQATLSDPNGPPLLRAFAAHRMALLEPKSPRVRSALVKALQDQDFIVRYHATNELRRIAPEMLETNGASAH
jgi:HEAT repeat protein